MSIVPKPRMWACGYCSQEGLAFWKFPCLNLPRSGLPLWGCSPRRRAWALPKSHMHGGLEGRAGVQPGPTGLAVHGAPRTPTPPWTRRLLTGQQRVQCGLLHPGAPTTHSPLVGAGSPAGSRTALYWDLRHVGRGHSPGRAGLQNESAGQEDWPPGANRELIINTRTPPWDPQGPSGLASASLDRGPGRPVPSGSSSVGLSAEGEGRHPGTLSPFSHRTSAPSSQSHGRCGPISQPAPATVPSEIPFPKCLPKCFPRGARPLTFIVSLDTIPTLHVVSCVPISPGGS